MISAKSKRIRNLFKSMKTNSYPCTILFYNNPVTRENNYIILKKLSAQAEMSVTEFVNCLIEQERLKSISINNNSHNLKTKTNDNKNKNNTGTA